MDGTFNLPESEPDRDKEPEIILLAIENSAFYLYKGDEHLNQLLLCDGVYPTPILCVKFSTIFDVKRIIGEGFSTANCWAIHPEVIERLRNQKCLLETEA